MIESVTQKFEIEVKERRFIFLGMLLGTLGSSLLQNILSCKDVIKRVMEYAKFYKTLHSTSHYD